MYLAVVPPGVVYNSKVAALVRAPTARPRLYNFLRRAPNTVYCTSDLRLHSVFIVRNLEFAVLALFEKRWVPAGASR